MEGVGINTKGEFSTKMVLEPGNYLGGPEKCTVLHFFIKKKSMEVASAY
jgi:hypothetical protein